MSSSPCRRTGSQLPVAAQRQSSAAETSGSPLRKTGLTLFCVSFPVYSIERKSFQIIARPLGFRSLHEVSTESPWVGRTSGAPTCTCTFSTSQFKKDYYKQNPPPLYIPQSHFHSCATTSWKGSFGEPSPETPTLLASRRGRESAPKKILFLYLQLPTRAQIW